MLNMMRTYLATYVKNEDGQGMAEYGLIIALVAVVVIAGMTLLGGNLNTFFTALAGRF